MINKSIGHKSGLTCYFILFFSFYKVGPILKKKKKRHKATEKDKKKMKKKSQPCEENYLDYAIKLFKWTNVVWWNI